ncbi:MAG: hypothetical protein WC348_03595 [Patescibacteria group bacterium]|jgi:ABC-type transport system involved in cytochrome c biogenesis permease subunit
MTEEEKVREETLEFMERHSARLRKWREENLSMRDEFASENTYKFSPLIISLSVGIMGGMSFLLSNINELNSVSKFLSLSLALPIISIILEIEYRKGVLNINRGACSRRADFIENFMKNEALKRFENPPKSFQELIRITTELDETEKKGFDEIVEWIKTLEPKYNKMRKFSLGLLGITLVSIIVIIFSETNIFNKYFSKDRSLDSICCYNNDSRDKQLYFRRAH